MREEWIWELIQYYETHVSGYDRALYRVWAEDNLNHQLFMMSDYISADKL